jgi:UDP-glucose 4-epimerase
VRILVTGATGFIGQHLIALLQREGHGLFALSRSGDVPGATTVRGGLENLSEWKGALKGLDAVVHCAAHVDPIKDEAVADAINRQATVALARASAEAGVGVFVFLSSIAAIGRQWNAGLVPESVSCAPHTVYSRSKRAAELELLPMDSAAFRVLIPRPPTVYGPGDRKGNLLNLARAVCSRKFLVPGDGHNRISFCHVHNLNQAIEALVRHPNARGIVHVADSMETTFGGVVSLIGKTLDAKLLPIPFPLWVARPLALALETAGTQLGFDPPLSRDRLSSIASDFAFDLKKLKSFGVEPGVSFENGAAETLRWYREQGLV